MSPAIGHLAELAERGVVGFKAFLCNSGLPEFPRADDLTLYEGMREAARLTARRGSCRKRRDHQRPCEAPDRGRPARHSRRFSNRAR
jgi:hypothetical protein